MSTSMPTPAQTAHRAKDILAAIVADAEFVAFEAAPGTAAASWPWLPTTTEPSSTCTASARSTSPRPILDGSGEGFVRFTAKMLDRSKLGQTHADAARELAEELVRGKSPSCSSPGTTSS
ncbi:hypothetical protein ACFWBC_04625 [Streptomyces sp. NPDC059985]|uniref:hypothetical protein n=1 Tax=Streptomyces sp. NPDC059985 TaxID=3347025 RepID=UPI0036822BD9